MIEQLMEMLSWALALAGGPLFLGEFGGGSKEPTVDRALTLDQLQIYNQNIGPATRATDRANQESIAGTTKFGLGMVDDSGNLLNKDELKKLNKQQTGDEELLKKLNRRLEAAKTPKAKAAIQVKIDALTPKIAARAEQITTLSNPNYAGDRLKAAFSEEFALADGLKADMAGADASTAEYTRAQEAFGRGVTARTSDAARIGSVADVQAGRADRVGNVTAGQVGTGALGQSLMGEAMRRMQLQGRLSDQDSRDVTQATRAGFAARGMATGNASLGAELLNRDRFTRQRAFQDMGFAQGIQDQDLKRQFDNTGNTLRADQGNQATAMGLSVANLDAMMRAGTANQATAANLSINQANLNQGAGQFNAGQLANADAVNMNLLDQSAARAEQERLRKLALGQDLYNFTVGTNPNALAAGVGKPYASLTGSTAAAANAVTPLMLNPQYSGGQLSNPYMTGSAAGDFGLTTATSALFGSDK